MKPMRVFLALVLAAAMLVSAAICSAEVIGDYELGSTEADICILYCYYGYEADLVIPSSFEMYGMDWPVGAIGDEAFIYNTDLKTVVVPEGVTSIGARAFYGCEEMESIILPSTLDTIQDEAFAHCTSLKQITLPDYLYYVGADVFKGCESLILTPAQQSALANTEHAADMAQQAAFVVDTDNLVDLAPYMGTSFGEFVACFDDMQDCGWSDGTGCANKDIEVATGWASYTDYVFDSISYISINRKCNYSLFGVYVGMEIDEAKRILINNGWQFSGQMMQSYSFEDYYGNYIDFWSEDGATVNNVVCVLNWEISYAIDTGNSGGYTHAMSMFWGDGGASAGSNEESYAASSIAYTTGDVKLRSGPGLDYDTVGTIGSGIYIEYLGESSVDDRGVAWYHVFYNGMTGWSSSKYVELR